jgi:hypothetical protein
MIAALVAACTLYAFASQVGAGDARGLAQPSSSEIKV